MSGGKTLYPLTDEQAPAVAPGATVWLSASAGTGKTQVLSSRVLRLLMEEGVSPGQILCLTFTKAGATEMAGRINQQLARWVRASDTDLGKDLQAIGAASGPEARSRARTLFAAVLDCPGGGLRIDTIHAFAQWLLAAFPHEAGLTPGMRAMEDRDRALLLNEVLGDMLVEAERTNDAATLQAMEDLSVRYGPDAVPAFLLRCAGARSAWEGPGSWQPPMLPRLQMQFGLEAGTTLAAAAEMCADGAFETDALECCLSAYRAWGTASSARYVEVLGEWLSAEASVRMDTLAALREAVFNKDGKPKYLNNIRKFEEDIEAAAEQALIAIDRVLELKTRIELAEWLTPVLELGHLFAKAWDAAKARAGLIDFDDQIRLAAELLSRSELADWIRYKLDRRFDHILVDEAQDTNAAQWQIIGALVEDFWSGEGPHADRLRTLFVVGDYKQAIFGFQGTSPENFEQAKHRIRSRIDGLAENLRLLREERDAEGLRDLGLRASWRTAQPVLQFVDAAIAAIGPENFGLKEAPAEHPGLAVSGRVVMWQAVGIPDGEGEDEPDGEGAEGWLDRSDRKLADQIARQVRLWIETGYRLEKGGAARRATAGDVMVLVRKRKELAGLIVARLHARGVPVAGVDRLRLGAPLAVKDLMAALRFATQPYDDLSLAALLVSPLLGWTQEDLLEHGYREPGVRLWDHLRNARGGVPAATVADLIDLLNQADNEPPQALLHWLLTGPWRGRQKLVARLGSEANDPIDELLNAATAYAGSSVPSLLGFIRWFDAGEGELKREAGRAADEVRVMTVHGSKGLEAPIVILADAADNPDRRRPQGLDLPDRMNPDRLVPLPALSAAEQVGAIADLAEARRVAELQEHWRLLYVAMTRAQEGLYIAGALGRKEKEPAPNSWYARLQGLFAERDGLIDPIWGSRIEWGDPLGTAPASAPMAAGELALMPAWASRPSPAEPRPPRPLAPSALGEDQGADPPWPPATPGIAARRGILLHKLLERLPDLPEGERKAAAQVWLARFASEFDAAGRNAMAEAALAVVSDKAWADLFGPAALAEVPIAATVGNQVVAGTIDRLLIGPDRIQLVDFKTARRPPASLDEVPVGILRQMAAYAAALEATYPGRRVDAALLYTQVPVLLAIPADLLAVHKLALQEAE